MRGSSDVEWFERGSVVRPIVAMATLVPVLDAETVRVVDMARHNGLATIA